MGFFEFLTVERYTFRNTKRHFFYLEHVFFKIQMFCVLSLVGQRPTFNSGRRLNQVITFGLIQFWAEGAINRYFYFHLSTTFLSMCIRYLKWAGIFNFVFFHFISMEEYFYFHVSIILQLLQLFCYFQSTGFVSIIMPSKNISTRGFSYFHFTFKQPFLATKFSCSYYIAINEYFNKDFFLFSFHFQATLLGSQGHELKLCKPKSECTMSRLHPIQADIEFNI